MFYFIHPTDENFLALWYRQYLGLSKQQRLNILLKGSHIPTCTEASTPSAIKSAEEPRSSLAVHTCVWRMHVNVEALLLDGVVGVMNTIQPWSISFAIATRVKWKLCGASLWQQICFHEPGLVCHNHMPDWSASKHSSPSFQLFSPLAATFLLLMSLSLDPSFRVSTISWRCRKRWIHTSISNVCSSYLDN